MGREQRSPGWKSCVFDPASFPDPLAVQTLYTISFLEVATKQET